MSRNVVENIKLLPERNLFMKGVLSWVGGEISIVEYARAERIAGTTKFNGWKLWNLALEGITGFFNISSTNVDIYRIICCNNIIHVRSMDDIDKILFGNNVPCYPSLLVSILFLVGFN